MKAMRIVMLALSGLAVAPLLAQGPMREGRWEVTAQMEMPGMKMPASVTSQCITPEQLKDPANGLPSAPGGSCTATDYKRDGNKVTWKMACTGQMAMTGDGELTFAGDTYTGTINAKMEQTAMTMKLSAWFPATRSHMNGSSSGL